jgi:hypothetical protein
MAPQSEQALGVMPGSVMPVRHDDERLLELRRRDQRSIQAIVAPTRKGSGANDTQ